MECVILHQQLLLLYLDEMLMVGLLGWTRMVAHLTRYFQLNWEFLVFYLL